MKKSAKDNKNKYPYDLLIPLFLMVLVCPFVVRLALVSTGLGDYLWYPEDDRIADLYSYFRSRWMTAALSSRGRASRAAPT